MRGLRFEDVKVGDRIPALSKVVRREDVRAYADASGDQNPLHQDDPFARSVGFPGIIAHGMFISCGRHSAARMAHHWSNVVASWHSHPRTSPRSGRPRRH